MHMQLLTVFFLLLYECHLIQACAALEARQLATQSILDAERGAWSEAQAAHTAQLQAVQGVGVVQ